jgi:hypothetical protein
VSLRVYAPPHFNMPPDTTAFDRGQKQGSEVNVRSPAHTVSLATAPEHDHIIYDQDLVVVSPIKT